MRFASHVCSSLPRQAALLVLASAIGVPAWTQTQSGSGNAQTPSSATSQTPAADQQAPSAGTAQAPPAREGFWGRINPMARKKWVKKQIDPINDRLNELDQLNAQNAQAIKDVDSRAQAGIHQTQSAADAANQAALAAGNQAQTANNTAEQASNHVTQIGTTVNGLDQYHQVTDFQVSFRPGTTTMSQDSKDQLDRLAASLTGRDGYVLEMDAHAPGAGSAGIQRSEQLADAVERYLVVDHQIPLYRMHSVAMGNEMASTGGDNSKPEPVRTRMVHVRLMENSLAAQGAASPQGASPSTGTAQP